MSGSLCSPAVSFPQPSANEREGPGKFSWRRVQKEPLGTGEQLARGWGGEGGES